MVPILKERAGVWKPLLSFWSICLKEFSSSYDYEDWLKCVWVAASEISETRGKLAKILRDPSAKRQPGYSGNRGKLERSPATLYTHPMVALDQTGFAGLCFNNLPNLFDKKTRQTCLSMKQRTPFLLGSGWGWRRKTGLPSKWLCSFKAENLQPTLLVPRNLVMLSLRSAPKHPPTHTHTYCCTALHTCLRD